MVGGTTGEGMMLSLVERQALSKAVVDYVASRAPVIVHTGCISTSDTIELTAHAQSIGATAASIIVPYFFKFEDDSLFSHFVCIARTVPDLPIFLYCFPGNANNDISPALLERLLEAAPNIVGMKVTNGDLLRLQTYIEIAHDRLLIFNGKDGLMLPALAMGVDGQVSGNCNAFPEVFCGLYESFVGGDIDRARMYQRRISHIRAVMQDGLHPGYYKAALRLKGVRAGKVRPPMREAQEQELKRIEELLQSLGYS
jgi:4-hydroxy-tetrahydrodipicolinate synthase